jgi:hypothetical protein
MTVDLTDLRALLSEAGAETPEVAAAADRLRLALEPLFQGFFLQINAERGITVEFSRAEPTDGPLKRLHAPAYVKFVLAPTDAGNWKADSKVRVIPADQATKETIENHKLTFRRMLGVGTDKAVEGLIKWFKTNAEALKGKGPGQGPWLALG